MLNRPALRTFVGQLVRFALVGTVSFCVTTVAIYALRGALGPMIAGIPAYLLGITTGWLLNRSWTFRHHSIDSPLVEWLRYTIWTAPSILVNAATYEVSLLASPFIYAHPVLGTAAGAIAGMFVSYAVVRWIVFKPGTGASAR